MITIVYRMIVKKGQEAAFKELAESVLIPQAQNNKDCLVFSFHQSLTNSCEFLLYERYVDKIAHTQHQQKLVLLLGPSTSDSGLPDAVTAYFERTEDVLYQDVL